MTKNIFEIVGYHGTLKDNVKNILDNGYTCNKRDDHWLGQGIYFYKDKNLAKWFATRKYRRYSDCNIAILKSCLCADFDKVLDLDSVKGVDFVYQKINDIFDDIKITFNEKDDDINRCIILDILKESYDIDIIVMTFKKRNQSYGKANIKYFENNYFPLGIEYSETQICATNNDCIESSKEVVNEGDYELPNRIWFREKKKR